MTKGYNHDENMTYENVPSGGNHNVCSHFNPYPTKLQNAIYSNCASILTGFTEISVTVWDKLMQQILLNHLQDALL
ncbi:hypothetical protein [Helicobacter cetorum]|uniref:Putative outer membrane protein HomB n=1 Tax=Helicobacter cetorum (strain ATCC BAA-540 / CCUG 52418 / MIT 99-5656) TaxID=1163745 RepID=I0ETG7_HELCM|nr:hypothetical protein [Helicobacter cetorum]AFI06236.1 putative outer membrane protein HomB [Helicobacter cetorum MIT 99-5656]